jgi:hypothetical protein
MKSKLLLCLALVVFAFDAQLVRAFDEPYEVNRTNITTRYFSFLLVKAIDIHPTNNNEVIVFRIIVMPKEKHQPEQFGASLNISDGNKYILWAELHKVPGYAIPDYPEIPKSVKSKSVMFEFSVSTKYLANSEVELKEGLGCGYLLKLKEFAYVKQ